MQGIIRDSLVIKSKRSHTFLCYLCDLMKKELLRYSTNFNSSFLYYNNEIRVNDCIESLTIEKHKIYFKMEDEIRYLIFNNRQLYWYYTIQKYKRNQDNIFLRWRGSMNNSSIKLK